MGARFGECVCLCVCFHMHFSSVVCVHLHVHERDQREGRESLWVERKTPKSEGSLHSRLRSCSIYKNSKTFITRAPVVCLRIPLGRYPRARVKINKSHTIEGFLLFGSRGRGSYFVVHWSFWSERWAINTVSATRSIPLSSPCSMSPSFPEMKNLCAAGKQGWNKHAGSCF